MNKMDAHDLFSKKSGLYARVRPHYPEELFQYLESICEEHKSAWDAACGNGQAAVSLARYFKEVQASDISEQQIAHAKQNPKVIYSVQPVEETSFAQGQFDLVCVAQALHWFDFDLFWPEVKWVLKLGGIFAAWGYTWFLIEDSIDEWIREKILRIIEPYWAPQIKLLLDHYQDVPFPFVRLETPEIRMIMSWDLNQLFAYLQSWSATRLCKEERGNDFLLEAYQAVRSEWGNENKKKAVEMEFFMLVGRNDNNP